MAQSLRWKCCRRLSSGVRTFRSCLTEGIRRGSDVIKCLALGAKFVFLGRPFVYAAAVGGQGGVERAIDLLSLEIDRNLAMLGITRISELTRKALAPSD